MTQGQIRIIGGLWRGRLLKVPDVKDLRPTPNRVRETLFNWLAPHIAGARCLDLFAGSGALGFEALSRGALWVEMVDVSSVVTAALQETLVALKVNNANVVRASVPSGLPLPQKKFDIVFLDPPFQEDLLLPTCHYLESHDFLSDGAFIYLEAKDTIKDNQLPSTWRLVKSKQAGQVAYHLAQRES